MEEDGISICDIIAMSNEVLKNSCFAPIKCLSSEQELSLFQRDEFLNRIKFFKIQINTIEVNAETRSIVQFSDISK